jgi:hypothetical protein
MLLHYGYKETSELAMDYDSENYNFQETSSDEDADMREYSDEENTDIHDSL